jgi:hypothetical protein
VNNNWRGIEVSDDSGKALPMQIGGQTLRLERLGAELHRYGPQVVFGYAGDTQQPLQ